MPGVATRGARRGRGGRAKKGSEVTGTEAEHRTVNNPEHCDISSCTQWSQSKMIQGIKIRNIQTTKKTVLNGVQGSENRRRSEMECSGPIFDKT